ncbi:hypothetical protein [Clostridium saudiense]|uniref:hypothetical protein n=1 Tax=Clostridium saudiense TaxID=1414720 RepID=UPI0018AAB096|nr:hypothetical protein [Clostridium saudiense]
MDKKILVESVRKFTDYLVETNGEVKLSLLLPNDESIDSTYYTFVISAEWLNNRGIREPIAYIFDKMIDLYNEEIYKYVSRVTVLNTNDPFVKDISFLEKVHNDIKPIYNINVNGVEINYGVLFECIK